MTDETKRPHSSHKLRGSDASSFDLVCENCGRTDISGHGWGKLVEPCPASTSPAGVTEEEINTLIGAADIAAECGFHPVADGIDAIIDRLASAPSQAETRRKALEEALRSAPDIAMYEPDKFYLLYAAWFEKTRADALRSLATGEPT